jgi:hypothetical protein
MAEMGSGLVGVAALCQRAAGTKPNNGYYPKCKAGKASVQ